MTLVNKKNISTFKLYTDTIKLKKVLIDNDFILFFYFQFFNHKEQLILKKLLKQYNLASTIVSKKNCNYVFKNTNYLNLNNITKSNLLLIYSKNNNHNNNIEAIKLLITENKLELLAIKVEDNFYRASQALKYSTLNISIQNKLLYAIAELLTKIRMSISVLKIKKF